MINTNEIQEVVELIKKMSIHQREITKNYLNEMLK